MQLHKINNKELKIRGYKSVGSCNSSSCGLEADISTIIEKHGRDKRNLIPLLHDLQD